MLGVRFGGLWCCISRGAWPVAKYGHDQYRESVHLTYCVERRVPSEQPLLRLGEALEAGFGLRWVSCGAPSPAPSSQLKPGEEELSQLSWGALLRRLSGPATVCYYFYKGRSVCWIMFGQLLMHSCGRGWVGISLLYFQTVDPSARSIGGNGKKANRRIWSLSPLSPDSPRVNPERLTVERREEGITGLKEVEGGRRWGTVAGGGVEWNWAST